MKGQFAIASARLHSAGRIFAVDCVESRVDMARAQDAEVVDFNREDPVETLQRLTGGIGPDRAIDSVGVDAVAPSSGPAGQQATEQKRRFRRELAEISPEARAEADQWRAGDAPSQALGWAVKSLAKAGTLSISHRWTHYPASGLPAMIGLWVILIGSGWIGMRAPWM